MDSVTGYFKGLFPWRWVPQIGEVARLDGVTRLSIKSLILMWSRLHDRWGNQPHVTSPTWGPPPSCKQALTGIVNRQCVALNRSYGHLRWSEAFFNIKHGNCFIFHFTNLFRAELDEFDYFIWKKANLKQIGNFL